ncbi:MAG TPA: DUF5050 domain-containing protein [Spirochaetes bacterium]|nr:DUF5050 domain-containing protein [Spirochaetota bacterium]
MINTMYFVRYFLILLTSLNIMACDFSPHDEDRYNCNPINFKNDIYEMDIDGNNQTRLTYLSYDEITYLSYSPDGTKIIYSAHPRYSLDSRCTNSARTSSSIYTADSNGLNSTLLYDSGDFDVSPSYSPDGTKIVFMSYKNGNFEVYVIDADGTNPVNLSNHPSDDSEPSYSPSGNQIVFKSRRNGGDEEIYIMNSDGTNPVNLSHSSLRDASPSVSPDGNRIVFYSFRIYNLSEIFSMDINGANLTRLTFSNSVINSLPKVSSDGNKITFVGYQQTNNIYIMDINGNNLKQLTNNPSAEDSFYPSFSPDGTKIIYVHKYR